MKSTTSNSLNNEDFMLFLQLKLHISFAICIPPLKVLHTNEILKYRESLCHGQDTYILSDKDHPWDDINFRNKTQEEMKS